MDAPRPTWLNQLPQLSIFELDEAEYAEWARRHNKPTDKAQISDAASTPSLLGAFGKSTTLQPQRTSQHKDAFGLDELKEEIKQSYQGLSCMAVHAQDMYLAVGRQIRHVSLAEVKKGVENHGRDAAAAFVNKKQHKVLDTERVDFDIRRLVINPDGKLMAVVGDERIVIVVLTKAIRQDPKTVSCKSFALGEFYHIDKGPTKIVKVLWHPLSKGLSHVLVMTQDNILRMYNVAVDIDEPEQVFNFGAEGRSSNSYGLIADNAASFCFGSKFSPWGQLSVYSVTESGDIFMMCPVMPETCLLDIVDVQDIRSHLESPEAFSGESTAQQSIRKKWLLELQAGVRSHPFSDEIVIAKSPSLKQGKALRQGPFLYQPAPIELDDDDNRAYDILCLETEATDILVIAHSSGRVDISIVLDRPSPRWGLPQQPRSGYGLADEDDDDEDDLPIVGMYESLDLGLLKVFGSTTVTKSGAHGLQEAGLCISNHPVLVADSMYGDTFYVYHEMGAHCISIRPWLGTLTQIYEDLNKNPASDVGSQLAAFYKASVKSDMGSVVTTRPTRSSPAAPIIGFSVVADPYLEYSLLLLTSSLQLTGLELSPRPRSLSPELTSGPSSSASTITVEEKNKYQPTLPLPMFENQGGLMSMNGLPLQPKVVFPPGVGSAKIITTEENLRFLGKMVQGIRESLREVYTACDLSQQRLVAQEAEYKRQVDKVDKEHERIENALSPKNQQQATRLDGQIALQRKLIARADELLQKLNESPEPELSPAEKAWNVDLARNERVFKTYNERKHKVQAQQEILKRRVQDLQAQIGQPQMPSKRYGSAQLKHIIAAKEVQDKLVKETEKMMLEAKARFAELNIVE
ncbi:hypothetical protein BGZ59_010191 [Podila verticillata]|nr:hypothetical protein BGZ59_010191 [Podila verticillata]KFH63876.1 hypothetical protein MVEG_10569 [Podila verticillata NRRL 6337]